MQNALSSLGPWEQLQDDIQLRRGSQSSRWTVAGTQGKQYAP